MNCISLFFHTLFEVPGRGIYKQNSGFPMGTNIQQPHPSLLCKYKSSVAGPALLMGGPIDDLVVIHSEAHTAHLVSSLRAIYPAQLPFEV